MGTQEFVAPLGGWGQGKDPFIWFKYFKHALLLLTQFSHVLLSAYRSGAYMSREGEAALRRHSLFNNG